MARLKYGIFSGFLLLSISSNSQIVVDEAKPPSQAIHLAPFKRGFASVRIGDDRYYINTKAEKIRVLGNGVLGNGYQVEEYESQQAKAHVQVALPTQKVIVEMAGKQGVLSPIGELLVPAEYDHIDAEYAMFWALYRGGKKTFYLPGGHILPFFDDIGYLDGEYFDVQQDGEWHLYSKSTGKVVTKQAYEGFDYCGGCSVGSSYLYAKKDGKWGIIDWNEELLVPFAFEHEHRSMRSDNWVQSFSQNGKEVIVHIPTQQVFPVTSAHTKLVSGMLVTQRNGLFGAYNQEGQLAVPFEYDELVSPNDNSYLGYYGNYLVAGKNGKKGVIGSDGAVLLPVIYTSMYIYDDYFVAKKDMQTSLFHKGDSTPLITIEHAEITHANEYYYSSGSRGMAVFRVKQKAYYGLYFAEHNRFYEPAFYDISLQPVDVVDGGQLIVGEKQGVKTLFRANGEHILPFGVEDYRVFDAREKSLLAFKAKGKWGLYDCEQDKVVVPANFDQYFKLLDSSANVVIQVFENGYNSIGLYDLQGNALHDALLDRVEWIGGEYYLVATEKEGALQYAIFDAQRKALEGLAYPFVAALSGTTNLVMVSENGQQGQLYDFKQKKLLRRLYDTYFFSSLPDVHEKLENWLFLGFENGYAQVQSAASIGFIDESGEVVISPQYAKARMVGDNYVLVSDGEYTHGLLKSYFIGMKGERIFPKEYFVDDMLFHNMYGADTGNRTVLIRTDADGYPLFGMGDLTNGELLIPAEYEEIAPIPDQPYFMLIQKVSDKSHNRGRAEQKYGLATMHGEILFQPQFDGLYRQAGGTYRGTAIKADTLFPLLVYLGDKWRYINEDGSYLPIEGDHIDRW